MNIKQAKAEIKHTVKAYLAKDQDGMYRIPYIRQRPILLMGPPGIGKTQIMEQIARECRIGLVAYTITHHTRQSAVGLPYIKEETFHGRSYSITEYTMSEIIASIYRKIETSGLAEGILFIDEINCVSETLAPTMLQFLQCKTFGNQSVPHGWIIAAAGNPPEYNKSVRDFDMVTLDRVRCIDLEADFSVWKEYAKQVHIQNEIISYLELRPKNFYRIETDVDGMRFVTARGWEDLSCLMEVYKELDIPIDAGVVGQFLHHEETAQDAAAYFGLYHKYQDDYGIADILNGKIKPQISARIEQAAFDERLSVISLLTDGLSGCFTKTALQKARTDLWYAFLKDYRRQLSDARDPHICYARLEKIFEDTFVQEREAGLLNRTQIKNRQWLVQKLKEFLPQSGLAPQAAFAEAKKGFDQQQEILEQAELAAGIALEYAFDFMEQAFLNGQEMVVFITDLTLNHEAAAFLAEHPSERFTRYSQQLLIGTRRQQLLSELDRDIEQFT